MHPVAQRHQTVKAGLVNERPILPQIGIESVQIAGEQPPGLIGFGKPGLDRPGRQRPPAHGVGRLAALQMPPISLTQDPGGGAGLIERQMRGPHTIEQQQVVVTGRFVPRLQVQHPLIGIDGLDLAATAIEDVTGEHQHLDILGPLRPQSGGFPVGRLDLAGLGQGIGQPDPRLQLTGTALQRQAIERHRFGEKFQVAIGLGDHRQNIVRGLVEGSALGQTDHVGVPLGPGIDRDLIKNQRPVLRLLPAQGVQLA